MDRRRRELVLSLFLSDSEAMIAFGRAFAGAFKSAMEGSTINSSSQKSSCILPLFLEGDLGAGKTHFAKGLIHCLSGVSLQDIPSPTFSLKIEYPIPQSDCRIVHADLYRIAEGSEILFEDLIEDLYDSQTVVAIEWPKTLPRILAKDPSLSFYHLFFNHEEDGRSVEVWYDGHWMNSDAPYIYLQASLLGALP